MYAWLSTRDWRDIVTCEGPGFLVAWLVGEALYKFHSFTLECAAFLLTWYGLSRLQHAWLGREA